MPEEERDSTCFRGGMPSLPSPWHSWGFSSRRYRGIGFIGHGAVLLAEHQVNSDHILTVDGARITSPDHHWADDVRPHPRTGESTVQPVLAQRPASLSPSAYSHIHASSILWDWRRCRPGTGPEGGPISTGLIPESLAGTRQTALEARMVLHEPLPALPGSPERRSLLYARPALPRYPVITLGSEGSCASSMGRR